MARSTQAGRVGETRTHHIWDTNESNIKRTKLRASLMRWLGAAPEQYLNLYHDRGEFTVEVSDEWDDDAGWSVQVDQETRLRLTDVHLGKLGAEMWDTLSFKLRGDGIASVEVLKGEAAAETPPELFFLPDEVEEGQTYIEGAMKRVPVNAYERSPQARRACLRHHGTDCSVCGFSFEESYGEIGAGYIHVHHLKPLAQAGGEYELDPVEDLRPVCPNCHAMLHKRNPPYSIEELREILELRRGAAK